MTEVAPPSRRSPLARAGSALAVLLALALPGFAWWSATAASEAALSWLAGPQGESLEYPIELDVPRGESAGAISRRLQAAGLLPGRQRLAWVAWLALEGRVGRLQAGEYRLDAPLSPEELARMMLEGRVLLHAVTVPEGLTLEETASALAASGLWTAERLEEAFRDPSPIAALDARAPDLEGYLFPETYHFARTATAGEVARAMTRRFLEVWSELRGTERSAELGLGPREVVTLASLVERETAVPQEHRLVSSVFHNRLRRGMKMECDPTVIRALQLDGLWTGGPLLKKHLAHPSPYNTYHAPGLPPGPIAAPGRAALSAALDPAESRLLFFVADGTGGHAFAETLAQHQRNVRKWRRIQRGAE